MRKRSLPWPSVISLAVCVVLPALTDGATAELKVQLGHAGGATCTAFSADGRLVLTGGYDRTARLWDVATGREIRRFTGHAKDVSSVAFSPDGRSVLTGSSDTSVRLWDLATGHEIRRFSGHKITVNSAAFSHDGRFILTGGNFDDVRLWDLDTGSEIRDFRTNASFVSFSPDDRMVLTAYSGGKTAALWDAATGGKIRELGGHTAEITSAVFSPDGRSILTGGLDASARLWDAATGNEIRRFETRTSFVSSAAFSPDGRFVLTASSSDRDVRLWDAGSVREIRRFEGLGGSHVMFSPDGNSFLTDLPALWDIHTGREIRRFTGYATAVTALAFSPDSRFLMTAGGRNAGLWDLASGRETRHFQGHFGSIRSVAFSPDGRSVVTASHDTTARTWDVATARETHRLPWHTDEVLSAVFSPDGRRVLTLGREGIAILWDAVTGSEIRRFLKLSDSEVSSIALSPDGRSILTSSWDRTSRLWDVSSGAEIRRFSNSSRLRCAAFSPDGRFVLGAGDDGTARLWDAATGEVVRTFTGHTGEIMAAMFSADGRQILTSARTALPNRRTPGRAPDNSVRLWDAVTGRELRRFEDQSAFLAMALSPDGRALVTAGPEGGIKVWDPNSGRLLATFLDFQSRGWAVVDSEGRYDASDPDNSLGLYWQLRDEIIELRQLKNRFYAPNLLGRKLGFNPEPLPPVAGLDNLQLWPAVELKAPQPAQPAASIRLTDRGGGIGRVVIKVNGRELPMATRGAPIKSGQEIPIDLSAAQLAANGENTIEVIAYDKANLVAGRGGVAAWKKAPENAAAPATLRAIVAGASNYEKPELALRFPAKDALDMAHALEVGGKRLFGVDHVEVARLATGTDREPTKENIRQAFAAVRAKAGPNDVLLVYLAGHGVAGKSGGDLYYYLTRDARSVNPEEDARLWHQTTISSAELLEWLRQKGMPLRQVVVLDTCAAGAAIAALVKLADRRELTADQRRALELLKDATGSHILMGAAADKVSYEASRYGQGLLTYSLLRGMRGEALDEGGRLDVVNWFRTAQRDVPELAEGIGGIQQPVISSPGGQTFPIALFTPQDREEIPLPALKPQLLRARVEDEDQNDPLQLEEQVRLLLRTLSIPATRSEVGPDAPLVYLDQVAGDVAGAYIPQIRYRVTAGGVAIRLRLVSGKDRQERNIDATGREPAELATRIVAELVQMLPAPKAR